MNPAIILPIIVLLLAFGLKLAIGRDTNSSALTAAFFELPVDILFLSLSFLTGNAISANNNTKDQLYLYCFLILIVAIFIVILWRQATKFCDNSQLGWGYTLTAINYFITIYILINVIQTYLITKQNGTNF